MLGTAADKLLSIPDALLLSLVGFTVVFLALVALIGVIKAITFLSAEQEFGADKSSQ